MALASQIRRLRAMADIRGYRPIWGGLGSGTGLLPKRFERIAPVRAAALIGTIRRSMMIESSASAASGGQPGDKRERSVARRTSVIDALGRTVHLAAERWEHVVDGHPYMAPYMADVLRAIESPTDRIAQARPGQDWFYLEGAGPSRWIKVVVAFDEKSVGNVRTAFPRRDKP